MSKQASEESKSVVPESSSPKRDDVRGKIFSNSQPKSKIVDFFGGKIELRQVAVRDIEEMQRTSDRKSSIADALLQYAFVPGTDEKVFEQGDLATLQEMPFGPDFSRVLDAITELTTVDTGAAIKN